jgi:hypothetical protein
LGDFCRRSLSDGGFCRLYRYHKIRKNFRKHQLIMAKYTLKYLIKNKVAPHLDLLIALFALLGFFGVFARRLMASSSKALPITRFVFCKLGYLPIRDHYYEPLTFNAIGSKYRERVSKLLFDGRRNFDFLKTIARSDEFISEYSDGVIDKVGFRFNNGSFESGDAETLFYFVRSCKPKKIVEIGAGISSLLITAALRLNDSEGDRGEHVIIEPYENPWLEKLGSKVIRERVELVDFSVFQSLEKGDILFIDSSHVIRAQNDCVFEYTELLPSLPSGVVVHIHDIFTPFDYPDEWLNKTFRLWAEQYLLEALLLNGDAWEVLAPLNWLSKDHDTFKALCPFFEDGRLPGSIWIRKR